jgi:hypothetical protein
VKYVEEQTFKRYRFGFDQTCKRLQKKLSMWEGSGCLMVKVSDSQPRDNGFQPKSGHDHVSSHQYSLVPGSGIEND